jgi:hypothetical protein
MRANAGTGFVDWRFRWTFKTWHDDARDRNGRVGLAEVDRQDLAEPSCFQPLDRMLYRLIEGLVTLVGQAMKM